MKYLFWQQGPCAEAERNMLKLDRDSTTTMTFDLEWESSEAKHKERYLAREVNMWRDVFPPRIEEALIGREVGEVIAFDFAPGETVSQYLQSDVRELSLDEFRPIKIQGRRIRPQFGRFYPKGFLRNVPGVYPEGLSSFRAIGVGATRLVADPNHPLAQYPLHAEIRLHDIWTRKAEYGGRYSAWLEEVTEDGPGMQARWQGRPTDFTSKQAYSRRDEKADLVFHLVPRLVGHVDFQASMFIRDVYASHLSAGDRVLDLMSSVESHLPLDMDLAVVGLGLNEIELAHNPGLAEFVIHDLNENPALPFRSEEFQAVVCSLSIEYLTDPMAVMYEVVRVLELGGRFLVSFSNRWFPQKATYLWTEIHEFERMGLVLDYFLRTGAFEDLHTYSARNWWRPEDDPHVFQLPASDPVYVVWGTRRSSL